jgi:hypothetical protein
MSVYRLFDPQLIEPADRTNVTVTTGADSNAADISTKTLHEVALSRFIKSEPSKG